MARDNARSLIGKISTELGELAATIKDHPYLTALENGDISRRALEGFAGHQYNIIGSDMRSVARLLSRYGSDAGRTYLTGLYQGEAAAFEGCLKFAAALGRDEQWLAAYEPAPEGVAYANYVAWLSACGSDAELAAAFLVNFDAWGANCGRMGAALEKSYGIEKKALGFFELFANTPHDFEEQSLAVVDAGLERGVSERSISRAARLLQGYELMYWEAMSRL